MKNSTIKTNLLLLFLYLVIPVEGHSYTIRNLGIGQGLSNNYIVGITQDANGFLWFATEYGLNKFDGNQFSQFTKQNSGICGNELNQVLADTINHKIYIASQRDGLSVFDYIKETFQNYDAREPKDENIITNDVTNLSHAYDGGIWICTYHRGVDHYDPGTDKFRHYYPQFEQLTDMKSWCTSDDGGDYLYIGHAYTGLSRIGLKDSSYRNYQFNGLPNGIAANEVRSICIDRDKNVWIGTANGLCLYNPATEQFTHFKHQAGNNHSLLSNYIFDIRQMKDGSLWIATELGGISILNLRENAFLTPENVRFINIMPSASTKGLSSSCIRTLFQDKFGNIWVGNYRGGIDFISYEQDKFRKTILFGNENTRHKEVPVWGICADTSGKIWMGTEQKALIVDHGMLIREVPYQSAKQNIRANVIYQDTEEKIWMGFYLDNLSIFNRDGKLLRKISDPNSIHALDVRAIYQDGQKMWIGTETGLYSCDLEGKNFRAEESINLLMKDQMIRSILKDKEGKLWVATFGLGIYVFDTDESKVVWNFIKDNGFCSNAINDMYKDKKNRIWVGTREGLALFAESDQKNYVIYNEKDGLNNSYIRAIAEDSNNQIWISTNGGISSLSPSLSRFHNYDYRDGIQPGTFVNGGCITDKRGEISFASQSGVCTFDPNSIPSHKPLSPLSISTFTLQNKSIGDDSADRTIPVHENKEIRLPHNQNSFKITFNIPDYTQNSQVEYKYKMTGLSPNWYNVNDENGITFRSLPSGKYTFLVKAKFRNQEWGDGETVLHIRILPPFWFSWWANTCYGIIAISTFWLLLYHYKKRIGLKASLNIEQHKLQREQDLNNERMRFYTNITHELRTPLTLILGPLDDLQREPELPPALIKKTAAIYRNADQLLTLVNELLEFRKTETDHKKLNPAKGDMRSTIQEICLNYCELNQNKEVKIIHELEQTPHDLYFDADVIRIILNNLLSNALKYTPRGIIRVKLDYPQSGNESFIRFSVTDSGYGISQEAIPHIFDRYYQANDAHQTYGTGIGLSLVKNLVDLHQGEISIQSEIDKGTHISILLKSNHAYEEISSIEESPSIRDTKDPEEAMELEKNDFQKVIYSKKRILIIEDNIEICHYIGESLEHEFDVLMAHNGKIGLESAFEQIPDLIISDIMMPVLGGIDLCRSVKNDIRTSHIPIILLTAMDSNLDKEKGYEAGADSYLTKPFSASLLHSRINNILSERNKLAEQFESGNWYVRKQQIEHSLNKVDPEFITRINGIIESELSSDQLDVNFIAGKMCMSSSSLYRKMKSLTGLSTNEYIRKIKIHHAERLLLDQNHTISEIAFKLGFCSDAYFRQCFKAEKGVTPSAYIRNAAQ